MMLENTPEAANGDRLIAILDEDVPQDDDEVFDQDFPVIYITASGERHMLSMELLKHAVDLDDALDIFRSSMRKRIEVLRQQTGVSAEVLEQAKRCKKLIFMLNSNGSTGLLMKEARKVADAVRKNGGEVAAYGTRRVQSAAAQILLEAQKDYRFVLQDSTALWHPGATEEGDKRVIRDEELADYTERLQKNFLASVSEDRRDQMQQLLSNHAYESDLVLSGEQLQEYDLVAEAVQDSGRLLELFQNNEKLPVALHDFQRDRLSRFFAFSIAEEKAFLLTGERFSVSMNPKNGKIVVAHRVDLSREIGVQGQRIVMDELRTMKKSQTS